MTSKFLKVIDPNKACDSFPEKDLACSFPFPLDPFQKHAIKAIHEGNNVLVTAKTGSGKTMVGEYLIHHCLRKGKRVFYTTPIKSLSNQKFHDLKKMFPSVGIMTGDIKYRPDADVLIMTTEILRNLLYKQGSVTQNLGITGQISLEGLGGVVFDEVHYINDRERGKVWEETMILLKPDIQQVLLSATIDHPELFASWLADLKQKEVYLLSTSYRIVPLVHQVLLDNKPLTIMDNKEVFYEDAYKRWLDWRTTKGKDAEEKKRQVQARKLGGYEDPVVKSTGGLASFPHQLNQCVEMLREKELMPALFFVFSRAGCEKYAKLVQGSLIPPIDSASIEHIWNFHLHSHKELLEHLPQAHQLLELCKRGIAYHHSGLLPILREIVEILFGKGLLKCLFATETFAVGINMPTKTVVFLDYEKYSDESNGLRILRTDEYIQMAGRAGRRGKDTMGYVFYLPQRDPIHLGEAKMMMTGKKSAITSQMDFGYDFLLKTLQSKNIRWMDILQNSYWNQQLNLQKKTFEDEVLRVDKLIQEFPMTQQEILDCKKRNELEEKMKVAKNKALRQVVKEFQTVTELYKDPVWANLIHKYNRYLQYHSELQEYKRNLAEIEDSIHSLIEPRLKLLQHWGFLDESMELTDLGIYATEINEGHQILMAFAYDEKLCEQMSQSEFVAFLAVFLNEGSEEFFDAESLHIPSGVKDAIYKIEDWAKDCQADEDKFLGPQKRNIWTLQSTWVEPIYRWFQGENIAVICQDYEVYEGNFVRNILKVGNMVEEWMNLATYTKNVGMLQVLEGLHEKLVRDIVKPDSLYLKL